MKIKEEELDGLEFTTFYNLVVYKIKKLKKPKSFKVINIKQGTNADWILSEVLRCFYENNWKPTKESLRKINLKRIFKK